MGEKQAIFKMNKEEKYTRGISQTLGITNIIIWNVLKNK